MWWLKGLGDPTRFTKIGIGNNWRKWKNESLYANLCHLFRSFPKNSQNRLPKNQILGVIEFLTLSFMPIEHRFASWTYM